MTDPERGEPINVRVRDTDCPTCHVPGRMQVWRDAYGWPCGHAFALPPRRRPLPPPNRGGRTRKARR